MMISRLPRGRRMNCLGDYNKSSVKQRRICEESSKISKTRAPVESMYSWDGATRSCSLWRGRANGCAPDQLTVKGRTPGKSKIREHRDYNFGSCDIFIRCKRLKSPLI